MYSPSNTFRELFYHTILNNVVALFKKTKEIKDKERNNQKDINKEQTYIEENDVNQEKVKHIEKHIAMDTSKLETQPIHNEKQDEENVVNQEKGANTEDQKSQSIYTSKLETRPILEKE